VLQGGKTLLEISTQFMSATFKYYLILKQIVLRVNFRNEITILLQKFVVQWTNAIIIYVLLETTGFIL